MIRNERLKILYVSAEVSPFAKTGGLADVAGSLPKALALKGNDIRVVMPKYKGIDVCTNYIADFPVQMGGKKETCIVRETETANFPLYFIDNYNYYDKDGIYGHFDDGERFIFFCKAVLEMLPKINFQPDIIHCNDWHTGPICMLLKEHYYKKSFYSSIATVFTIHNLEYQGNFPKDIIKTFNINEDIFTPEKAEFYGGFSFMKAGIVYADLINTVSGMYAKEIQTPEYGERMDGLLRKRSKDLYGIVNGINYEEFNPESDTQIFKNYSINNIIDKKENKYELQKEFDLPVGDMPVIGLISRLSSQKGLNLIIEKIDQILDWDLQFILLGTGDNYYHETFAEIKKKYPKKFGLRLELNFISIDYGIIEKSSKVMVVPAEIGWNDLGSFDSFYNVFNKDEANNIVNSTNILLDSSNNIVYSEPGKLVAAVGVEDLIIIDNRDALLVCKKEESQKVKEIVKILKERNDLRTEYHIQDYRPWGYYKVLEEEKDAFKIKRITLNQGKRISYQLHHHRSEHWIVVKGMAKVTIDGKVKFVRPGESIFMKAGQKHRLENPGKMALELIEVQMGEYLEEDDIVRFDDEYGRK
jgi:starch synthase